MALPELAQFFILEPPREINRDPTANFNQLNKWQWDLQQNSIPQQQNTIIVVNAMREALERIAELPPLEALADPGTATLVETATKVNEVVAKVNEIIAGADINTTPTALATEPAEEAQT